MKGAHILVVDDNPTNSKLACTTLKFAGYHVSSATDAVTAQDAIHGASFDLILMDVAMPGMDGLTLTRKLKTDEKTRHIPIVVVTASAMKGDDQRAFAAGCDGYIAKPINTRLFPKQVAAFLPSNGSLSAEVSI